MNRTTGPAPPRPPSPSPSPSAQRSQFPVTVSILAVSVSISLSRMISWGIGFGNSPTVKREDHPPTSIPLSLRVPLPCPPPVAASWILNQHSGLPRGSPLRELALGSSSPTYLGLTSLWSDSVLDRSLVEIVADCWLGMSPWTWEGSSEFGGPRSPARSRRRRVTSSSVGLSPHLLLPLTL